MDRLTRLLLPLVAPLIGVSIALAVVEIAVRVLVPLRTDKGPGWSDRPQFYFRAPTATSMQDYPHAVLKPANVFRIAAIRDSFTFAPYMQFTDTFPQKLEQILSLNLHLDPGSRQVEVINYGVPAYSTSHEIPVAKKALEEGADLVIIQITLNDPEIKHHNPTGITENMPDRFGALNLDGRLGWLARYWRTLGFVLSRMHNSATHQAYIDYFNDLFENPRSWKQFSDSTAQIVALTKRSDKPIVGVLFPLFGIPMDNNYPFYPLHQKIESYMQSLNVPLLDLSNIYKGIPLERLQVIPGVDRHPNEIAHRMVAEEIYLWLEALHLVPAEFLIKERFATRLGTGAQRAWEPKPIT